MKIKTLNDIMKMLDEMSAEMEFENWNFTTPGKSIKDSEKHLRQTWYVFAAPSVGSNEGYWVDVMEQTSFGTKSLIRIKLFDAEKALETCTRINRALLERE